MAFILKSFIENPNLIDKIDSKVIMICEHCNKQFDIGRNRIRQNLKRGDSKLFCSQECSINFKSISTITLPCSNCGVNVKRTHSEMSTNKSGRIFCSKSCAAIYNNKAFPKRIAVDKEKKCKVCGEPTSSIYKSYCEKHKVKIANMTLEEAIKQSSNSSPSNRYRRVRDHALNLAKKYIKENNVNYECFICGYSKFVDVCHIQDISKFPLNTLVSEINKLSNLTFLCPNHHEEFDHDLLETIPPNLQSLTVSNA